MWKSFFLISLILIMIHGCGIGSTKKAIPMDFSASTSSQLKVNSMGLNWELIYPQFPLVSGFLNQSIAKPELSFPDRSKKQSFSNVLAQVDKKPNVDVNGLNKKMLPVLIQANLTWARYGKTLVITSALDGKHCANSRHYYGMALDIRSRDMSSSQQKKVFQHLRFALGDNYKVLLERDHFHIEYDPRPNLSEEIIVGKY